MKKSQLTRGSGCCTTVALRSFQLISRVCGLLSIGFMRGDRLGGFLYHAEGHVGAGQTHLLLQGRAGQVAGIYQAQVAVFQRPRQERDLDLLICYSPIVYWVEWKVQEQRVFPGKLKALFTKMLFFCIVAMLQCCDEMSEQTWETFLREDPSQ